MSELKFEDLPKTFCSITVYPEMGKIYAAVNGEKFNSEDHYLIKCDNEFSAVQEIRTVSWFAHIMPARMGGAEMCVHDVDIVREEILAIARQDYATHCLKKADWYEDFLKSAGDMLAEDRTAIRKTVREIRKKFETSPSLS